MTRSERLPFYYLRHLPTSLMPGLGERRVLRPEAVDTYLNRTVPEEGRALKHYTISGEMHRIETGVCSRMRSSHKLAINTMLMIMTDPRVCPGSKRANVPTKGDIKESREEDPVYTPNRI